MLSVIIVTWDSVKEIGGCLDSVFRNIQAGDEVIVVDNFSSDGTPEFIEKKYPEVKLIKNAENTGFARGANKGAKNAKGKYLVFLNPDTVVKDGAFWVMEEYAGKDSVSAFWGPRVFNKDGSTQPSCGNFPTAINLFFDRTPFLNKTLRAYCIRKKSYYEHEREPDWISGCCIMTRKNIFEKLNGFDEGYFMYGEDVDLCYRGKKAGFSTKYIPIAGVVHFDMGRSEKNRKNKSKNMKLGVLRFYRKNKLNKFL